ncbi:MAG: hypothetical protein SGI86_06260 [Deltaproteobacteria bacterium]|nr:hypothetical protein [Deltaproteobacteria bacterium]
MTDIISTHTAGMLRPRLIAFEGVDGAGKTTALALVAARLRERGIRVYLPRCGKDHASRPVRAIRDLTRNRSHVDLDARAELLLYCAREAQVLTELVAPALARGDTVLIDRSLLTPIVLGCARGLPRDVCERAADVAAAGVHPDLTLVFDVDTRTSRIRKRLERTRSHGNDEGGRKGLAGSAFKERVRDLYAAIATRPGHALLRAERATPAQLAERAMLIIEHGEKADTREDQLDGMPLWMIPGTSAFSRALETLPVPLQLYFGDGLLCGRETRWRTHGDEPALCAFALDPEDPLREQMAAIEPEYVLRGYARRTLSGPDDLRLRLFAVAPAACIVALKSVDDPWADDIREQNADRYPDAVLISLQGREDVRAQQLRQRCWREAGDNARATSLTACSGAMAWNEREALYERDPVLGLKSVRGLPDARAQTWLDRYAESAPKIVLEALAGRADAKAYELREQLFATGREVIDSLRGLDDEAAWALRERAIDCWPSTVVHSLLGLETQPRAQAMVARCNTLNLGDIHLLKRIQQFEERPLWPAWARERRSVLEQDT